MPSPRNIPQAQNLYMIFINSLGDGVPGHYWTDQVERDIASVVTAEFAKMLATL